MFTNQVALKPQKSLIAPSIERIRKWRSEANNYSSKIEKNIKIEEKEKIAAAVLSNSSLEIKSSPVKEKPSMKKPPKSKKDKVETEEQIAKRLTKPGKLRKQEGMPAVYKRLEKINFKLTQLRMEIVEFMPYKIN